MIIKSAQLFSPNLENAQLFSPQKKHPLKNADLLNFGMVKIIRRFCQKNAQLFSPQKTPNYFHLPCIGVLRR